MRGIFDGAFRCNIVKTIFTGIEGEIWAVLTKKEVFALKATIHV